MKVGRSGKRRDGGSQAAAGVITIYQELPRASVCQDGSFKVPFAYGEMLPVFSKTRANSVKFPQMFVYLSFHRKSFLEQSVTPSSSKSNT